MIQTKEFALTKNDFLKILCIQRAKRSWIILVLIIILAIMAWHNSGSYVSPIYFILYAIFYPIVLFTFILRWVYSKDNKNHFKPMQLNFGSDKVSILLGQSSVFDTPTTSEIAYDNIIKKELLINYYLLYVAKNSFIIIPKDVFKTEEDFEAFKKLFSLS